MSLVNFLSTLLNFILSCLDNIQSFLLFIFDLPGFLNETLNTFPSVFVVGFTAILSFIAVSVVLKVYRDLH